MYDLAVLVFKYVQLASKVIENLNEKLDLVQTKEVPLTSEDAARIFGTSLTRIWEMAKKGTWC